MVEHHGFCHCWLPRYFYCRRWTGCVLNIQGLFRYRHRKCLNSIHGLGLLRCCLKITLSSSVVKRLSKNWPSQSWSVLGSLQSINDEGTHWTICLTLVLIKYPSSAQIFVMTVRPRRTLPQDIQLALNLAGVHVVAGWFERVLVVMVNYIRCFLSGVTYRNQCRGNSCSSWHLKLCSGTQYIDLPLSITKITIGYVTSTNVQMALWFESCMLALSDQLKSTKFLLIANNADFEYMDVAEENTSICFLR